jgi:hypothetical protein
MKDAWRVSVSAPQWVNWGVFILLGMSVLKNNSIKTYSYECGCLCLLAEDVFAWQAVGSKQ